MHGFAQSELAQPLGRFTNAEGKQHVVGTSPTVYPPLPSSSPWHGPDPVGLEPPLGIDINQLEPAGIASSPAVTGPASAAPLPRVQGNVPRGAGPSFNETPDGDGQNG
jgi:hypothetical protein